MSRNGGNMCRDRQPRSTYTYIERRPLNNKSPLPRKGWQEWLRQINMMKRFSGLFPSPSKAKRLLSWSLQIWATCSNLFDMAACSSTSAWTKTRCLWHGGKIWVKWWISLQQVLATKALKLLASSGCSCHVSFEPLCKTAQNIACEDFGDCQRKEVEHVAPVVVTRCGWSTEGVEQDWRHWHRQVVFLASWTSSTARISGGCCCHASMRPALFTWSSKLSLAYLCFNHGHSKCAGILPGVHWLSTVPAGCAMQHRVRSRFATTMVCCSHDTHPSRGGHDRQSHNKHSLEPTAHVMGSVWLCHSFLQAEYLRRSIHLPSCCHKSLTRQGYPTMV